MIDLEEIQIDDRDFLKFLQENKNQETEIQLRLIDNKNNKVVCKMLTIKELLLIEAGISLEWHNLTKEKRKNE